jgi:hypothetical protein
MRQIAIKLEEKGIVNPETKARYDVVTIKKDIDALRREWRREAKIKTEVHMARQLAELAEVKREAWKDGDLDIVLKALTTEMKLLGTGAPDKVEIDWRKELEREGLSAGDVFESLVQTIQRQIESLRDGAVDGRRHEGSAASG